MMNEEQKADPFTRRKTLPQLVSMVRLLLTERKANFIKIATTLEKKNPCHWGIHLDLSFVSCSFFPSPFQVVPFPNSV